MADIIEPLTQDERTVLMIAAEGESMMAIGRWEQPIESLVRRGFMVKQNRDNITITPAGRKAIEAMEKAVDGELAAAWSRRPERKADLGVALNAPVGPSVAGGVLFFKMPNGSAINCNVAEPFASEIVEMWRSR